ncbi:MAG: ATP-binding protein [Bryobacteraceae bacterium]
MTPGALGIRNSIKRKLIWINTLASGVALMVASVAFVGYELSVLRQNMVRTLSVQAQIVGSNSASALLFSDPEAARKTLSALEAEPNIMSAVIHLPTGEPFAVYTRSALGGLPPAPRLAAHEIETSRFTSAELALVRRIVFQGQAIGTVYIRSDLRPIEDSVQRYVRIVAAVLLISLLAAMALSALFQGAITRPLVQLAEIARVVSREKRFSVRAPAARSRDEVAVLVDAFNDMLAQIQQREEERQKFVSLVEQTDDFIGMTGFDGRAIYINRAGCRLVGLDPSAAVGTPIAEFYPENWWVKMRDEIFPSIMRGEGNWVGEAQLCDVAAKRPIDVLMNVFPVNHPETGQLLCFASVIRDITERQQLEEQLRQSQKLDSIGQLAGGVAHDFNNLLVVIGGYASMMLEDLPPEHIMREGLEEIRNAGERASALTRQLLVFSRRQRAEQKNVAINDLVLNIEKMLRRLIGEDIDLVMLLDEGAGVLRADPVHLEQVIINLAVNARDAMPDGGKLVIETAHVFADEEFARIHLEVNPGEYVMLSVGDSGTGMTAEVKTHIFEPFFTTKAKGKGTGLGLSTVYGIVKQSGGSIFVYSEPGQGSTFKMFFPAVGGRPSEAAAVAEPGELSGRETILLAEDEAGVSRYVSQLLSQRGYTVLIAGDGQTALDLARAHHGPIHLLLTDVVMPGMGGLELAAQFAAARSGVPILFMSGYSDRLWAREGMHFDLIQKPFTTTALLTAIRKRLDAQAPPG